MTTAQDGEIAVTQMPDVEVRCEFTTEDGLYPGAHYHDYFRKDGLDRARIADTKEEADRILRETYVGPDINDIGVRWTVA